MNTVHSLLISFAWSFSFAIFFPMLFCARRFPPTIRYPQCSFLSPRLTSTSPPFSTLTFHSILLFFSLSPFVHFVLSLTLSLFLGTNSVILRANRHEFDFNVISFGVWMHQSNAWMWNIRSRSKLVHYLASYLTS